MVSVPSSSSPLDFQRGLNAYNRGDYQSALREWRPLAEQGYAHAQAGLGLMYAEGRGVVRSDTEAVKWFRKSAAQGNQWGQNNLGLMYDQGLGVAQSDAEAVKWYRMAAEQGNEKSQNRLKEMGIDWTKPQVAKAETKTAQSSNQRTIRSLQKGFDAFNRGDYRAALREWRPLAEQGDADAQFRLGLMYFKG